MELLKNKNLKIILIYFILLFILDFSGIMDLYKQNFVRRLINMARRRDYLSYKDRLDPFCTSRKGFVSDEHLQMLQSVKIPNTSDISVVSRKNTSTHQCCDAFSEKEKEIIKLVKNVYREKYEKIIGKKLYSLKVENSAFYSYHGKDSQHLWHVDPQNVDYLYNLIIVVDKKGDISPFQYKDKDGNIHSIHAEPGDAIFFRSGTTIHQVPPNNDENSDRTILSMIFIADKTKVDTYGSENLSIYFEGGNNYTRMLTLLLSILGISFVIGQYANINNLDYKVLFPFLFITLLIVKYIPLHMDIGLGTKRSSSIHYNLLLVLITIVASMSVKSGILFFIYFALSDVFFPRSWVGYD